MSTPIENNTKSLQEILDMVNSLPDVGSDGLKCIYIESGQYTYLYNWVIYRDGWTWSDYIESEYNRAGGMYHAAYLRENLGYITHTSDSYNFLTADGTMDGRVSPSDPILSDVTYEWIED